MSEKEFIKVKTLDGRGNEAECVINKDAILYLASENIDETEILGSFIKLKNGENIYVFDEELVKISKELLNNEETIKIKDKDNRRILSLEDAESFIDCEKTWNKDIGIGRRMIALRKAMYGHEKEIAEKIKLMDYKDFLQTPYWKTISSFLKIKKQKCEICGSTINLHTHHKTYNHHGYELEFLEDLEVICETCHSKLHKEYQPIYQNNTTVNTKQEEK